MRGRWYGHEEGRKGLERERERRGEDRTSFLDADDRQRRREWTGGGDDGPEPVGSFFLSECDWVGGEGNDER